MKLTPSSPAMAALVCLAVASTASAKEVKVSMAKVRFNPPTLQVTAGDTVVWSNDDDRGHTVVADDGSFQSGEIGIGGAFRHVFNRAGEFSYHCDHHPRMRGKVVVKDKAK